MSTTITAIQVGDLFVGEGNGDDNDNDNGNGNGNGDGPDSRMPIYVHLVEHEGTRVLVDTGLTELHPLVADMDPRLTPLGDAGLHPALDLASVDMVVNTHLHFDHCGGNHLFAGRPILVQRRELETARAGGYTIDAWVDPPGVEYRTVDGAHEVMPGLRLLPAPGHSDGSQIVVVESDGQRVVIAGDAAVRFADLDEPRDEGQRLIRALEPDLVWLSHAHEPWLGPNRRR